MFILCVCFVSSGSSLQPTSSMPVSSLPVSQPVALPPSAHMADLPRSNGGGLLRSLASNASISSSSATVATASDAPTNPTSRAQPVSSGQASGDMPAGFNISDEFFSPKAEAKPEKKCRSLTNLLCLV